MPASLRITYYISRDELGLVTDESFRRFKDELAVAFEEEWPGAEIVLDEDEESHTEIEGVSGEAEDDVRSRVEDIVTDVAESEDWDDEDDSLYDEEDEEEAKRDLGWDEDENDS